MQPAEPTNLPVLLIGGGRMGAALLKGWINAGTIGPVVVVEPAPNAVLLSLIDGRGVILAQGSGVEAAHDLSRMGPLSIVIAIKPQMFDTVLPIYRPLARPNVLILSIAAGKRLGGLKDLFGTSPALVRAMPNTPAEVGHGMTALVGDHTLPPDARLRAETLTGAVGDYLWCADEAMMDAVTALSGSGPAYVFLMAEAMTAAGIAQGLDPMQAAHLARATIIGAGALLDHAGDTPASLRQSVTSPGGTTAAALSVLMAPQGLEDLMTRALTAATNRSRELAQ